MAIFNSYLTNYQRVTCFTCFPSIQVVVGDIPIPCRSTKLIIPWGKMLYQRDHQNVDLILTQLRKNNLDENVITKVINQESIITIITIISQMKPTIPSNYRSYISQAKLFHVFLSPSVQSMAPKSETSQFTSSVSIGTMSYSFPHGYGSIPMKIPFLLRDEHPF